MKILLTGGLGFIGSHTAVELLEGGHEVVIADNLSNSKIEVLDKIKKVSGKEAKLYQIDICDMAALENVFEENKDIFGVIHFAGYKAVGESVAKPIEYYDNNLISTLVLLETMRNFGVKKFPSINCPVINTPTTCNTGISVSNWANAIVILTTKPKIDPTYGIKDIMVVLENIILIML